MAKFRKVDVRIWNDKNFNDLSSYGKLVFLFVLTHPSLTPLGAMRATIEGLHSELKDVPMEAFREAFAKGLIRYDAKACFVWLPNFMKYNKPENPNVLKSWVGSWDALPECALKDELYIVLKDFAEGLTEGFREGFREAFTEGFA